MSNQDSHIPDPVNPRYYQMTIRGHEIQLHEVITALGLDANHHLASAMEYIARHAAKNGVEDLRKAKWRIERAIERAEQGETTDAI